MSVIKSVGLGVVMMIIAVSLGWHMFRWAHPFPVWMEPETVGLSGAQLKAATCAYEKFLEESRKPSHAPAFSRIEDYFVSVGRGPGAASLEKSNGKIWMVTLRQMGEAMLGGEIVYEVGEKDCKVNGPFFQK